MAATNKRGARFGDWLLAQVGRPGSVGDLAAAAKADLKFPRTGSPEDVRLHLSAMQADGAWFSLVDDAAADWLSY